MSVANSHKWYVLNVHSGKEQRVVEEINEIVNSLKIKKYVSDAYVPQQKKIVITKKGKEVRPERLYPGYILVKMVYNEKAVPLLLGIEQVRGFVKSGENVIPLSDVEVKSIIDAAKEESKAYKISIKPEDAVKIVEGTFKDFIGKVKDVNEGKGEVTVLITMFGRETPRTEKLENIVKL